MRVQELDVKVLKMGPYRFTYNKNNDALYIQARQRDDGTWKSVARLSRAGAFHVATPGPIATATLEEFGER